MGGRRASNAFATDPSAGRLDELQTELDDGPCLRAVWEQQTVRIPDMATESRWPHFAAAAIQAGGWVPCSASNCSSRATTSGR